jgi:hypothetical protein
MEKEFMEKRKWTAAAINDPTVRKGPRCYTISKEEYHELLKLFAEKDGRKLEDFPADEPDTYTVYEAP